MKRIHHEGSQSGAPVSGWMAAWHSAMMAVERWVEADRAGAFDHMPEPTVRGRIDTLAKVAVLTLVRTMDGRQN